MRLVSATCLFVLAASVGVRQSAFAESKSYVLCIKNDELNIRAGKRCKTGETKATVSGVNSSLTTSLNTLSTTVSELGTEVDNRFSSIPSGKTVTGFIGYDAENVDSSGDYWVFGSLPAPLTTVLTEETVTVVNTSAIATACSGSTCLLASEKTESDASGCTGTSTAPTAPAGRLCIYPTGSNNINSMFGLHLGSGAQGFAVSVSADGTAAGNDLYFQAAWAYTAP